MGRISKYLTEKVVTLRHSQSRDTRFLYADKRGDIWVVLRQYA